MDKEKNSKKQVLLYVLLAALVLAIVFAVVKSFENASIKEDLEVLEAEKEMQAPILQKLTASIQAVAAERNLMFVLNTDDNAVPFVNPQMGVDISELVLQKLGLASAYSTPEAAK